MAHGRFSTKQTLTDPSGSHPIQFGAHLRKRKDLDFQALIPKLINDKNLEDKSPRWKESEMLTHDFALPLPSDVPGHVRFYSLLVLTPEDEGKLETTNRLEHLYHLNGGSNAGVFFHVGGKNGGEMEGNAAFARMQISLLNLVPDPTILLIPFNRLNTLPFTLRAFHARLLNSMSSTQPSPNPPRDLLPYASTRKPLPPAVVNAVGCLASSLDDLLTRVLATEEGRAEMGHRLGGSGRKAEQVLEFWSFDIATDEMGIP